MLRHPRWDSRRPAARAAEPLNPNGARRRVSKVATLFGVPCAGKVASHSRSPAPWAPSSATSVLPFGLCVASTAPRRVAGRLMLHACVGPPTTTRSAAATSSEVTTLARAVETVAPADRPSAIAVATLRVLPYMDSYTTSACMTELL